MAGYSGSGIYQFRYCSKGVGAANTGHIFATPVVDPDVERECEVFKKIERG